MCSRDLVTMQTIGLSEAYTWLWTVTETEDE